MGRFAPIYSAAQRWAITEHPVDVGLTARRTVQLAEAGELKGPDGAPLDPFQPKLGTVADYISKEKRRRRGLDWVTATEGTPEQRLDALTEQSLNIVEHQVQRLGFLGSKRDLTTDELERLRKAGQVAREIRSLARGVAPIKGGGRQAAERAEKTDTPPNNALTSQLVSELQQAAKQGEDVPNHNNGNTETSPVPAHTPTAVG